MSPTRIRRRGYAALLTLGLAAATIATTASAAEIRVEHDRGETVLKDIPKKVIVLDLASLDTLDAIAVPVQGTVGSMLPTYLQKYSGGNSIDAGSLFDPNYEALSAAQPDLIITGGRSSAKYDALAKIAPTINLDTDDKDYLASAIRNAETLGTILGKREAVAERVEKLKASTEALKDKGRKVGRGLIVLTTGGHMSAYGPGSRFGVLHDDFGVTPAAAKLSTALHGEPISNEFILKTNPDWLFIVDRDAAIGKSGQAAARMLDNELVRRTNAWKQGQVVYLDPVDWYMVGGGLTSMQRKVDQLLEAFNRGG